MIRCRHTSWWLVGLSLAAGCHLLSGGDEFAARAAGAGGGVGDGGDGGFIGGGGDAGGGGQSTGGGGGQPATGDHAWSRSYGDAAPQVGTAVISIAGGHAVIGGYYNGVIAFDGTELPLSSAPDRNIYLTRLDDEGLKQWAMSFEGNGEHMLTGLAAGLQSTFVAAGLFNGDIDLGGGSVSSSGQDGFVAKFDLGGNRLNSRTFGGGNHQDARGLAVDANDNVFVIGQYVDELTLAPLPALPEPGDSNIYVAKLNGDLVPQWARHYPTPSAGIDDVVVDSHGDVVICGSFEGSITFGNDTLDPGESPVRDLYVAKLSGGDGDPQWSFNAGKTGVAAEATALAVDDDDNVLMVGVFIGEITVGSQTYDNPGDGDLVIVKLDGHTGDVLDSKRFVNDGAARVHNLALDSAANLVFSGEFAGDLNLGGVTHDTTAKRLFVAKLDPSFGWLWSKDYADITSVPLPANDISVNDDDTVILTGAFSSEANFGGPQHSSAGSFDVYAAKLEP